MKFKINTYFAVLLIAIAGAVAAIFITDVAFSNSFEELIMRKDADYSKLKDSILKLNSGN